MRESSLPSASVLCDRPIPREYDIQTSGAFVLLFRVNEDSQDGGSRLEVLLVLRTDLFLWNLPGGGFIINEEDAIEGAIREVKEETGLDVEIVEGWSIEMFDEPIDLNSDIPGETRHDHYHVFFGCIAGGALACTDESRVIGWFPIDELPDDLYDKHGSIIRGIDMNNCEMGCLIGASIKGHKFVPEGLG